MVRCIAVALVLFGRLRAAAADPDVPEEQPAKRTPDLTFGKMFHGPFQSSRLYTMPTADTVGPYILSISGDGSLLQEPGILTSAGVLAIGFGDIAQLEYRHTSAISVTGINAPVPSVGVQLKVPIPEIPNVPAFGVAFRVGVPRDEQVEDTTVEETVHDLFIVGRWRFSGAKWLTLHGGVRISSASVLVSGAQSFDPDAATDSPAHCPSCKQTLYLPTGAYELQMNPTAKIVGEIALAPRFQFDPRQTTAPKIDYAVIGRFGMRWNLLPSVILDGSIGYQTETKPDAQVGGPGAIVTWDIRLGAEVFVPWGALACRAAGVFCE